MQVQIVFVVLSMFSPVGKMAMQLVATQMMSMVWNGPTGAQLMKTSTVGNVCTMRNFERFLSHLCIVCKLVVCSEILLLCFKEDKMSYSSGTKKNFHC